MNQIKLSYNMDTSDKSSWLTVTTSPATRASFAYVQELGDFYCGPDYFTARENLPSYMIMYGLSGEGILEYNNETFSIKPGNLIWMDCFLPQYYYTSKKTSHWHYMWVHLYGPTAQAYYNAFKDANAGSILLRPDSDAIIMQIFSSLFDIYRTGSNSLQDDILASSLLTQLMVNCIQIAGSNEHTRQKPDYVAAILSYINSNYQEDISLDVLSQEFSINKFYLQKLFKRHVGLSPNEYLARTRLARAKQLLRTTDDSVIRIAQEVGYTATYFDNVFKKFEGISPRAYRQRWYDSSANPDRES